MTVPTTTSSVVYTATGVTASFVYSWAIADQSDLIVYTITQSGTVLNALVLTTDYTVTGVGIFTGGTVVLTAGNPVAGTLVFLASDPAEIQQLLLTQGQAFNPSDIMAALDLLTREVQATRRIANSALQIPVAESQDGLHTTFPLAAVRAGSLVGFDVGGNATLTALDPTLTNFISAATLAALKAVAVPITDTIYATAGYYTTGDGGAGLYAFDALSAAADNGGTIIAPNAGSGRWKLLHTGLVDLKQFGAKGDGSTDDTARIQACLNAIPGVLVPDGTFIYSTLVINSGNRLSGTGTLKRKTTASIPTGESYTITAPSSANWSISGITLDGNRAGQSGAAGFRVTGMLLRGSTDWNIANATFINWQEGAIEATCATQNNPTGPDTPGARPADTIKRGAILGCFFKDCGQNADTSGFGYSDSITVQLGSTTEDITVSNCQFYNCMTGILAAAYNYRLQIVGNKCYVDAATYTFRSTAIAVEQMSDTVTVAGNIVEGFREGYNIESPFRCAITGNVSVNCIRGINGFASSIGGVPINMRELAITGNVVTGATVEGIKVALSSGNGAFDTVITGNLVYGGSAGIAITGLVGFDISGNTVSASTGSGIDIEAGCADGTIANNTVRGSTVEGIAFAASTNRVSVSGNTSTGNAYGIYMVAGQTDLTVTNNTFLNNGTKDFYLASPSANGVRHGDNRFITQTNAAQTIAADGASLRYIGELVELAAGTYTTFINHYCGQHITLVSAGSVTYTNNAAVTNKIFMRSGANVTDAANVGRTFVSDGTALYEC